MSRAKLPCLLLALCGAGALAGPAPRPDILIADFEGKDYGDWKVTGEAFGPGPARGTLPNQMPVTGYRGRGLVNSYYKGDDSVGTLTSPELTIRRRRINFLIGGGHHPGEACINLLVGGKVVRTATGKSRTPRDTEHLSWHSWDVTDLQGRKARIEIVDRKKGGWGHINIDHIVQSDREPPDERDELLARAEESVRRAAARIKADRSRPTFHVLPPANWLNDPNGPLYHKGHYHLFYQHNPYGDDWGHMHWGHVRSKDLVHWEHLPIALWPAQSQGEQHVFSGCAAVTRKGQVLLLYTSIGNREPQQWAAVPEDDDLVRWKKHPVNPIMTEKLHGKTKVHEWRDPYVFEHGGRTYAVLGGNLNASKGGQAVVNLYRAEDEALTKWAYLGVLFTHPDRAVANIECPLLFKLKDKWVLMVSPHGPVHYFVGELDEKTLKFRPERRGVVDPGHFYAPNCLQEEKGRRLLWGWVNGFPAGRGWRHCLTLPRVLDLAPDGALLQRPAPELTKLRGKPFPVLKVEAVRGSQVLPGVKGDALEIVVRFEPRDAKTVGLKVLRSADGKHGAAVSWDGSQLDVAGARAPLKLAAGEKELKLHVFLDRMLLEVYAGDGRLSVSRVVPAGAADRLGVELFAAGGTAGVKGVEAWPVGTIW
jgi:sucrose-6-phosphate hydrolase SacC (GH32 family)